MEQSGNVVCVNRISPNASDYNWKQVNGSRLYRKIMYLLII